MSPRRKPVKKEVSEIFEDLTAPEFDMIAPPMPKDPTEIAVACLLEDLAARQTVPFGKAELIIIEAPTEPWVAAVMAEIRRTQYGGTDAANTDVRNASSRQNIPIEIYRGIEFLGGRMDGTRYALMATDLLSSHSVWIVTHAYENPRDRLPVTIMASADRVLSLPEFTEEVYAKFLGRVTGVRPLITWQPAPLAELSPNVLRLAARAKQKGDDYARRIAKTIDEQRAAAKGEKQTEAVKPEPKIGLDQLHGMDEVVEWARALSADIRDYKAGLLEWRDVDRGAILVSPPGCGKTMASRCIAEYCAIPFMPSSYAEWQRSGSGHLGDVTRAISELFKAAQDQAPCIVFLDELDSVGARGSSSTRHNNWWRTVVNALLEALDGTTKRDGVVVLAATNDVSCLDSALLRPGRLDRVLHVGLPDAAALSGIFRHYLGDVLSDADFMRLGAVSVGKTGADVEQIARGARRRARKGRRDVRIGDVFAELVGEVPSPGDRSHWPEAIFASGHAAVMEAVQPERLRLVTLFGQGNAAGGAIVTPSNISDMTATAIDHELTMILGGRAAQEVVLNCITGGSGGPANSSLAMASWTAFTAEVSFGLGASSLLWSPVPDMEELYLRFAAQPEAAKAANLRVQKAYERAKVVVAARRRLIEAIAEALLDRYVLTADELALLLLSHPNDAKGENDAESEENSPEIRLLN